MLKLMRENKAFYFLGFLKITAPRPSSKSVTHNFGDFTARQASLLPRNSLKLVPLYGVPGFPLQGAVFSQR